MGRGGEGDGRGGKEKEGKGGGREGVGREGEEEGRGPECGLPRGPRWLSAGLPMPNNPCRLV